MKNKITFTEFKKWLKDFVISKGGKLPSVADWRVIKTKMDNVIEHDYLDQGDCTNCGQDFNTSKKIQDEIQLNDRIAEKSKALHNKVKFAAMGTATTDLSGLTLQVFDDAIETMNKKLYVEPTTVHNCGIAHNDLMEDTPIDTTVHKDAEFNMKWSFNNTNWNTSYYSQFE